MSKKRGNIIRDVEDYHQIKQENQVLHRSSMLLGSEKAIDRDVIVAALNDDGEIVMERKSIRMPQAVERVYLEMFENACDAVRTVLEQGKKCDTPIDIHVTKKRVSIKNGGMIMPVKKHKDVDAYVPFVNFAMMNSSSNYHKDFNTNKYIKEDVNADKTIRGRNGAGAKTAAIFSKEEEIDVADGKHRYLQLIRNNMTEFDEPEITKSKEEHVKITWRLDFKRFEYKEYDEDALTLFRSHCIFGAYTCGIDFQFNNQLIPTMNIHQIIQLLYPGTADTSYSVGYYWKKGAEYKIKTTPYGKIQVGVGGKYPLLEYAIIDTPDEGEHVSFVNGTITREGGTHVNAIYNSVAIALSEKKIKKKSKDDKGKEEEKQKKKNKKVALKTVKRHVSVIVNCSIPGVPDFNGNIKTKLKSPNFPVKLSDTEEKIVQKFSINELLKQEQAAAILRQYAQPAKNKRRNVSNKDLIDANYALLSKNKRKDDKPLVLVLVEGKSAQKTAKKFTEHDRNHYGVLPLRGKVVNAHLSKIDSLEKLLGNGDDIKGNREVMDIIEVCGYVPGLDYSIDENYETIVYPIIEIMTDADVDGEHIKVLLANLFRRVFPGLTDRKEHCIRIVDLPLYTLEWKKNIYYFNSTPELETFFEENPGSKKGDLKYYKGLGGFSNNMLYKIVEDKQDKRSKLVYDKHADKNLQIFLDPKFSDDRKRMILNYVDEEPPPLRKKLKVSNLIKERGILHAVANTQRTITSLLDGLKVGQRKIITACFLQWPNNYKKLLKVEVLGGAAAQLNYSHGGAILYGTIGRFTCSYQFSNNMALLEADGQFRDLDGNEDSAPRYLGTKPLAFWSAMFPAEFREIIERLVEGGNAGEYRVILAVIPLILLNGTRSVGTGWNSFVPGCEPAQVFRVIKQRILGEEPEKLKPWARGFNGTINMVLTSKLSKAALAEEDLDKMEDNDEEDNKKAVGDDEKTPSTNADIDGDGDDGVSLVKGDRSAIYTMITTAKYRTYTKGKKNITEITGLPAGETIQSYNVKINKWLADGKINYREDKCKKGNVHYLLHNFPNPTAKNLGLRSRTMLSNMNLLDENNIPVHFDTLDQIADRWYVEMLKQYEKLLQHRIDTAKKNRDTANNKAKYIELVVSGKINRKEMNSEELKGVMEKYELPYELVHMPGSSETIDKANKIRKEADEYNDIYKKTKKMRPEDIWLEHMDALEPYIE